jgi:urease accessory protein
MQLAEPVGAGWQARLHLRFDRAGEKTVLAEKRFDGPLAVQKPLYPEGGAVCHGIVVHPPGGIAGGDELALDAGLVQGAHALLTTPGAGKWYRSPGPWARQDLSFRVDGTLEWLPRETIVFDGARALLRTRIELSAAARYVGWEVLCLGRTGSGERFERGEVRLDTELARDGRLLWMERGRIAGGGALMRSPAGLAGHVVVGTLVASTREELSKELLSECRTIIPTTLLPGVLLARYLGDSSEEAMEAFAKVWEILRPSVAGRAPVRPRIWST